MKAIELQEVWKGYRVHYEKRIFIKESFSNLLRRNKYYDEFWALKDISLDIEKGEVVGIIGENGSGKTTILKLICGVTKPTRGSVGVNGDVVGLLELGAGFHQDLTGRENIYLNGLILGLTKREISRRIDSIIDFAGIGSFIDTPIRIYSAGMHLRLGFAIAANIDPDILLIDEVLAVGDVGFQGKCLEKIKEFKRNGKTIVFVSHDLEMVNKLCDRVILLNKGSIVKIDEPEKVIKEYLETKRSEELLRSLKITLTGKILIKRVYFKNGEDEISDNFKIGERMIIGIEYEAVRKILNPVFGIGIYDSDENYLVASNTRDENLLIPFADGRGVIEFEIKNLPFKVGEYSVSVSAHDREEIQFYDYRDRLYKFNVVSGEKKIKYGLIGIGGLWRKV